MTEIKLAQYRGFKVVQLSDLQECVGPGWSDIIEKLVADLFKLGWNGHVMQVKEKFGTLSFYIGEGNDPIWDRIIEAERDSSKACELCGGPGELRNDGWLKTLCDEHATEDWREILREYKRGNN